MGTWQITKITRMLALLGLAALAALYVASLAQRPKGSDQQQIRELMVRGERALEQRSRSAAMALVAREYQDTEGWRFGTLRAFLARVLPQTETVAINVPSRFVRIDVERDGRHATVQARADLHATTRFNTVIDQPLNLTLRLVKAPVRYYMVFPGQEWRLVQMEGWQALEAEQERAVWQ
jgi:hypothetical protein